MQKRIVALALVALVAAFGLAAQAAPATTAGMTDSRAIALEAGLSTAFNIGTSALAAGNSFGLMFTVSDNLAVGFNSSKLSLTYNTFKLPYFVNPNLGFSLHVGRSSAPNTAAGAGVFYNAFKSRNDAGISTSLKLKLEYFFEATAAGITAGDLALSIGSTFGL